MTNASLKDVFTDLDKLKLSDADVGGGTVHEVLANVLLRKPKPQEFVRVNADPSMALTTSVFIDKSDMRNEPYLVLPEMRAAMVGETRATLIVPFITRQGVHALWPLGLPIDDGRRSDWFDTAREAMERAKTRWVRMSADLAAGSYRIFEAIGDLPDPTWPATPLSQLLEIGFRGRIIDSEEHPVVRRLRGAA